MNEPLSDKVEFSMNVKRLNGVSFNIPIEATEEQFLSPVFLERVIVPMLQALQDRVRREIKLR